MMWGMAQCFRKADRAEILKAKKEREACGFMTTNTGKLATL